MVTFQPLSRNRYRCNQTGIVLKAGRVDSYRRSRLGELGFGRQPIKPDEPPKPRPVLRASPDWKGDMFCPHCNRFYWNEPAPGEKRCLKCGGEFTIPPYDMAALSAPAEVEESLWDGKITCPSCQRKQEPAGEGIVFNCSRCGRALKKIPRKPEPPPKVRPERRGSEGFWVFCPHCTRLIRNAKAGLNTCIQCGKEYELKP